MTTVSTLLLLSACGNNEKENEKAKENSEQTEIVEKENKAEMGNFPEEETGDGTFYLMNESGDTMMGQPIMVLYKEDTVGPNFDIVTEGFDGSHITYIYIDNELIDKEQLGDSQIQTEIPEHIKKNEGMHIVSLVQYEDDDTSKEAILVKHDSFEIKK